MFKSKKLSQSKKILGSDFFTPRARLAFIKLRQAFVKAPILHHFDLERHIRVETDVSGYVIGEILSQLTFDKLDQWYLVTFFSYKMILAETSYETYNGEFLAIIKAFKTWRYYLKGFQHKVFVLTDHNNLKQFMKRKSLSFRQVC